MPNQHWAGWTNTFLPGGGELLKGNYSQAALEGALEIGTFGYGYSLSKLYPITIDGVPEDFPQLITSNASRITTVRVCTKYSGTTCVSYANKKTLQKYKTVDATPVDATKSVNAAVLQEIGIKYHMMNVYNTYRNTIWAQNENLGQGIDNASTKDLLLSPFNPEFLTDPYVWIPGVLISAFAVYDFNSQISNLPVTQPLTKFTNSYLAFDQTAIYTTGSGAPEEMFYRGFLQNEFYHLVPSPFFSIPMSTLAFAFSHGADGRVTAAVSGAYLGFLAHHNQGRLGPGIALHFWSVMVLGVESYLLTLRSQYRGGPLPNISYTFSI